MFFQQEYTNKSGKILKFSFSILKYSEFAKNAKYDCVHCDKVIDNHF